VREAFSEPKAESSRDEDDNYFPPPESQGGWRKLDKPEEIRRLGGMDPDKLAELKTVAARFRQTGLRGGRDRHGYIVLEVERGNSSKTDSRRIASVSKAICATVLAIASEQSERGLTPWAMKFDDPAFQFHPLGPATQRSAKGKDHGQTVAQSHVGLCPEATGAPNDGTWEYVLGQSGDDRPRSWPLILALAAAIPLTL